MAEGLLSDIKGALAGAKVEESKIPGSLNQGWEDYFHWAERNHDAWSAAFNEAENQRVKESERWLEYYEKVYEADQSMWKKLTMFALNGVQIWALWKQFRQQKEIAKRTYEIANRIQSVAEELYDFYKKVYQPHEDALNQQIISYFKDGSCINYDDLAERFERNTRQAFARSKLNSQRCSSSYCGSMTSAMEKQWEIEVAQAVGNSRTGSYRYSELIKETRDTAYLELRMKWIQIGRGVSENGQNGIMKAFNTFSSFGADPGAALNQLLGTLSNTIGGLMVDPIMPRGNANPLGDKSIIPYDFFLNRVRQSGDFQPAKANKVQTQRAG